MSPILKKKTKNLLITRSFLLLPFTVNILKWYLESLSLIYPHRFSIELNPFTNLPHHTHGTAVANISVTRVTAHLSLYRESCSPGTMFHSQSVLIGMASYTFALLMTSSLINPAKSNSSQCSLYLRTGI